MPNFTDESIAQHTRAEESKNDLSLHEIRQHINERSVMILKSKFSLYTSYNLFRGEGTILPVECKRTIRSLEQLEKRIQQLCSWLNEAEDLPPVYKVLRYRLTPILYLIDEQICETSELIDNFRDICMTCSPSLRSQRREIYTILETLLSYIDDLVEGAESLDYEAHRLQRQFKHKEIRCPDDEGEDIDVEAGRHRLRVIK